ncbi:hypothetical protein SAMN05444169_6565 [Bradyrhizobium erythrophlei]|uniref:Uncharacterized protein n=2 Tax=Bradyrhizobium erythrophlei TaxID=1437360 RepID=A0A1M5RHH0_9BRAD|nr:hypothetical protein SAMN05444169_6565 [Bradyrhizobium erythrophlei]
MMRSEALKVSSFSEDLRIYTMPPSQGVGIDAEGATARLAAMRRLLTGAGQKISGVQNVAAQNDTIEGQLAEKRAAFKRVAASVGMYLDPDWRTRLFAKLDSLMDPEEWDDDFALPSEQSFSTFLRMIIYLHPTKRPGLGLSAKGHFLASWSRLDDRIVIESLANDDVRWVLSRAVGDMRESGAGKTKIYRIPDVIHPYEPDHLFRDGDKLLI